MPRKFEDDKKEITILSIKCLNFKIIQKVCTTIRICNLIVKLFE